MATDARSFVILMADDDAEDCLLLRDAIAEAGLSFELRTAVDGEELFDYLVGRGRFASVDAPRPSLILLDFNMPRKDGREALRELKADPRFQTLPIVVLTTSTAPDDVDFAYRTGASSYVTKPVTYRQWVDLVRNLSRYWREVVELPGRE